LSIAVPVPVVFVAPMTMYALPADAGVPLMVPLEESNVQPLGNPSAL
jgi:hypothetical protein